MINGIKAMHQENYKEVDVMMVMVVMSPVNGSESN